MRSGAVRDGDRRPGGGRGRQARTLTGTKRSDRIVGRQDTIDCGDGEDTVIVDLQEDGVFDCETIVYPDGAP